MLETRGLRPVTSVARLPGLPGAGPGRSWSPGPGGYSAGMQGEEGRGHLGGRQVEPVGLVFEPDHGEAEPRRIPHFPAKRAGMRLRRTYT